MPSAVATFDVAACRAQFPALERTVNGHPTAFFDGPGGTQAPRSVIDAVANYLAHTNANHGGVFATSVESDRLLDEAHAALADFVGTTDPGTIAFGQNMTSLTFALSRALAQTWRKGDEVIVTQLDHDANVSPWKLAARDAGAVVHEIPFDHETGALDLGALASSLSPRTRLVAVGCASNSLGTINPVAEIVSMAHAASAQVFLDAVHLAPHAALDVTAWDCDYLACSAYKFFGPHVGVLYGKRDRLEELTAYKLRPAPHDLPGKWMTGTQSHEGIAGAKAAVDYLASLGQAPAGSNRRAALLSAWERIGEYEQELARQLLVGLNRIPAVRIWGDRDPDRVALRAPTVSITHANLDPQALAERLAARGLFVWHGNFYALSVTQSLGLEPAGLVRIGLAHYNTAEEVARLLAELGAC
jgi:cysteine desulfurase family protein (TIGR01976 family)